MINSPAFDSDATVRVNTIRALAAGLVWGVLVTGLCLYVALIGWFVLPKSDWLGILLAVPLVGFMGFVMPLSFLIVTLIMDILLAPLNKSRILGFVVGLFVPSMSVVTALVMILGDPLVYLIWRKFPAFIPITEYRVIMFCSYIQVEKAPGGKL